MMQQGNANEGIESTNSSGESIFNDDAARHQRAATRTQARLAEENERHRRNKATMEYNNLLQPSELAVLKKRKKLLAGSLLNNKEHDV